MNDNIICCIISFALGEEILRKLSVRRKKDSEVARKKKGKKIFSHNSRSCLVPPVKTISGVKTAKNLKLNAT